jgi:hypothetical protein
MSQSALYLKKLAANYRSGVRQQGSNAMADTHNEPMTLVERLRNPQWAHQPNELPRLDVDRTLQDMEDAAAALTAGKS